MNSLRMASGSWNWVPFRFQPLEVIARIEAALEALTDNETSQRIQLLVTLAEGIYFVDPRRSATLAAGAVELARAEGCDADLADAIIGHLICTVGSEAPGRSSSGWTRSRRSLASGHRRLAPTPPCTGGAR